LRLSILRGAALAFLGLTVQADAQKAARGGGLDGVYSVTVTTEVGSCEKTQQGTVTIEGGRIVSTGEVQAEIGGAIGRDGSVSLVLRSGNNIAHVSGHIGGGRGDGAWSLPTSQCGGRWRAQRKG